MTSFPYRLRSLSLLSFLFGLAACSSAGDAATSSGAPQASPAPQPASDPTRAILEADIVQLDGSLLYAMSKSGSVSIVDVSNPSSLQMRGQTRIVGQPFEMYRRSGFLLAMTNGAVRADGTPVPLTDSTDKVWGYDESAGSAVVVLDVRDPAHPSKVATFPVPGSIADSRIVGNVLYLATYENAACYGCGTKPRTMVTSFDVTDATAMRQVDQASFQSNAPDSYNAAWGMAWKRSIFVTDQRLYIGGHDDIDPNATYGSSAPRNEGIIDVLDITDPSGHLAHGARINVPGAVLSRWQMDELNGVLRVISEQGIGRTGNGVAFPEVDTFTIAGTQSFVPLGHTTLQLPRQEGLRTVRFDGDRAYAITYNQTDPLFTIDLTDPAKPAVKGELKMPGFMFYLEPHGDRVIGVGIDRADPKGSLNVSLFDVSDMSAPTMLGRVPFAGALFGEDYEILNGELPEDQDRIQKAFHVFDDGLVVVPFSSPVGCNDTSSGVQLVSWKGDTLSKRALLPVPGNPRRAFELSGDMLTLSDSNLRSFSLANPDVASQRDDLVIGSCTTTTVYYPGEPGYYQGGYQGGYYGYGRSGCSVGAAPAGGASGALAGLFGLAFVGLIVRRRRTS